MGQVMCKTETDYLENLRKHASDTRIFLGNKAKPERERIVCRAFLRAIGLAFKEHELIAPTTEPADVAFQTARFQIREILEQNRRRGDDWKKKEKKYTQATSLDELLEPYFPPTYVNLEMLVPEIVTSLSEKPQRYGAGCENVDALVYINPQDQFLAPDSDLPKIGQLKSQGWRSVSVLFPPYGVILFATSIAPSFLTGAGPGQYMQCQDINSLFEAP
jgi:hypothetical protein